MEMPGTEPAAHLHRRPVDGEPAAPGNVPGVENAAPARNSLSRPLPEGEASWSHRPARLPPFFARKEANHEDASPSDHGGLLCGSPDGPTGRLQSRYEPGPRRAGRPGQHPRGWRQPAGEPERRPGRPEPEEDRSCGVADQSRLAVGDQIKVGANQDEAVIQRGAEKVGAAVLAKVDVGAK